VAIQRSGSDVMTPRQVKRRMERTALLAWTLEKAAGIGLMVGAFYLVGGVLLLFGIDIFHN